MRELSLVLREAKPVKRLIQLISPCTTVNRSRLLIVRLHGHNFWRRLPFLRGGIASKSSSQFYQAHLRNSCIKGCNKSHHHFTVEKYRISYGEVTHVAPLCVRPPMRGSDRSQDECR